MNNTTTSEKTGVPGDCSKHIQLFMSELEADLRAAVHFVKEPRFQALLETSSEVLKGLRTAFIHYDAGEEKAWRR